MNLLNQATNLMRDSDNVTSNIKIKKIIVIIFKKIKKEKTVALEIPHNKNETYHYPRASAV